MVAFVVTDWLHDHAGSLEIEGVNTPLLVRHGEKKFIDPFRNACWSVDAWKGAWVPGPKVSPHLWLYVYIMSTYNHICGNVTTA